MMAESFNNDIEENLLIESLKSLASESSIGSLEDLDKVNY